ncbi:MAG: hypothetical protein LBF95_03250 [Treponema sp.]|nr:hypothetical protein [Treponema sp.]
MKKAVVSFALVMMVLASCSTKQKVAGTWIDGEGELWIFGNDGKVIQEGERGTYSATDTQLSLSADGDTVVFDFSISSDRKTLLLNNAWYGSRALTKTPSPVSLAENKWADGSITSSARVTAYSFNAVSGKTYFVWTNDSYDGDETKSLDIQFSVFDENDGYEDGDDCWSDPCEFTASRNGRVTIVVRSSYYDDDELGTFAIAYGTSPTRP